jgi:hypothetical protein
MANRPFRSDCTGCISAHCPQSDGSGRETLRRLLGWHRGQTRRRSSPQLDRTVTNGASIRESLRIDSARMDQLLSRLDGLPARDHCGESDLPVKGGKGVPSGFPPGLPPVPAPVAHQRPKGWGRSHHQHPSRAARRCAGRRAGARGAAPLRLSAPEAGNPCCPASGAMFRESLKPQRGGLRPLRKRHCA